MLRFPRAAQPLIESFSIAFTRLTFKRFTTLLVGAVLAQGRRTLNEIQWAVHGPRALLLVPPRLQPGTMVALAAGQSTGPTQPEARAR